MRYQTPRLLAAAALAAFLICLLLAVALGLGGGDDGGGAAAVPTTKAPAPPPPAPPKPAPFAKLAAVGAYDPEGDGRERDEESRFAVDGRRDTAWQTERYSTFFKSGVGLVLDAGRRVRVERVVVESPTAGARAEIRLGNSPEGPFRLVSPAKALTSRTTFAVAKRPGRYVVVWIVAVPDDSAAEVLEVRARARG